MRIVSILIRYIHVYTYRVYTHVSAAYDICILMSTILYTISIGYIFMYRGISYIWDVMSVGNLGNSLGVSSKL